MENVKIAKEQKERITFFRHIGPKSEGIANLLKEHKSELEKRFDIVTVFASEADDMTLQVGYFPYTGEWDIRCFINGFCAASTD